MPYPQVLRHCTPVRKDTQTKNIPAPAHALFSYVFFSLRSDTTYRHANDKRCSNLPQQECHAVQKLLISVKQHCHAIHQKKQNEIRQHPFFPFQITAAVTDHFCSQISTVKNQMLNIKASVLFKNPPVTCTRLIIVTAGNFI